MGGAITGVQVWQVPNVIVTADSLACKWIPRSCSKFSWWWFQAKLIYIGEIGSYFLLRAPECILVLASYQDMRRESGPGLDAVCTLVSEPQALCPLLPHIPEGNFWLSGLYYAIWPEFVLFLLRHLVRDVRVLNICVQLPLLLLVSWITSEGRLITLYLLLE